MKKKWIWGAAVVLVLALSLGLYRFFTADDYRRTLPSRPLALAAVDWVRLSEENDMGMQDWKKLLPEGLEPGQTGIDWSKKMYAFVSSKEYVGLLAAVSDEADLRRLLDEAAKKKIHVDLDALSRLLDMPERKAGARLWKTIGATLGRYGTAVGWWVSVTVRCL